MHDEEPLTLIACGIFKKEFKSLPKELKNKFHPHFLNSMLHMNPDLLDKAISHIINKHPDKKLMLLYGDCSAHMHELASGSGRTRTEGLNCIEIFLGKDLYHTLRKQGIFFLMPEWALRWKEIFQKDLGLINSSMAQEYLKESIQQALYIDTGVYRIPEAELAAFSDYTGLPVRIYQAGLEHLIMALEKAYTIIISTQDTMNV